MEITNGRVARRHAGTDDDRASAKDALERRSNASVCAVLMFEDRPRPAATAGRPSGVPRSADVQTGLRPEVADVEQTQVGDGGNLLDRGEPEPGEDGVHAGPEQRFSVVERCQGDRQFVQPPTLDPAAQQRTQVLAELTDADEVYPSMGVSDQEHSIVVLDLARIGGPPDVGVVAELVGLPRRQHPRERLGRVVRVGPAGLVGQRERSWRRRRGLVAGPPSHLPRLPLASAAQTLNLADRGTRRPPRAAAAATMHNPLDNTPVVHTSV
jgi:hypothetical protein